MKSKRLTGENRHPRFKIAGAIAGTFLGFITLTKGAIEYAPRLYHWANPRVVDLMNKRGYADFYNRLGGMEIPRHHAYELALAETGVYKGRLMKLGKGNIRLLSDIASEQGISTLAVLETLHRHGLEPGRLGGKIQAWDNRANYYQRKLAMQGKIKIPRWEVQEAEKELKRATDISKILEGVHDTEFAERFNENLQGRYAGGIKSLRTKLKR